MKKEILTFCALLLLVLSATPQRSTAQTPNAIVIFDTLLYFDGYASVVSTPAPPAGVIRHRNDLYARKLSAQELASIGDKLNMLVTIKAACDNYDRIGNVNMALVPKGASTYNPANVQHIEIGRYITPFMNKNVQPDTVPYRYSINNVAYLFKETSITTQYDIWIELELFGVPYAANTEVAGCSGRNDVFYGSLTFYTNDPAPAQSNNVLLPLSFKKDFNNYQASATDTVGKTTRTITFNLSSNLTDAALFLVTSNHGANSGGEEYNRRNHYVYFDNTLRLTYKPGRSSCEPLRVYNTQANGIYGPSPRTDAQWQSFSNWCPGDTIPIRRINLGALNAGSHTFRISVPDAVFNGAQGNIPLSVYLQGKTSGTLAVNGPSLVKADELSVYPNPATGAVNIKSRAGQAITAITILNTTGAVVASKEHLHAADYSMDLDTVAPGLYLVCVRTEAGTTIVRKLQIVR